MEHHARKLGEHCTVKDWKTYASEVMVPPGKYHFKFAECKRYYVTRVKNKPGGFFSEEKLIIKVTLELLKA